MESIERKKRLEHSVAIESLIFAKVRSVSHPAEVMVNHRTRRKNHSNKDIAPISVFSLTETYNMPPIMFESNVSPCNEQRSEQHKATA